MNLEDNCWYLKRHTLKAMIRFFLTFLGDQIYLFRKICWTSFLIRLPSSDPRYDNSLRSDLYSARVGSRWADFWKDRKWHHLSPFSRLADRDFHSCAFT